MEHRPEAIVDDLRSFAPEVIETIIGLALEDCDVVFVDGYSDVRFGPDEVHIVEAFDELKARFPRWDPFRLPLNPRLKSDRILLGRLIPYTVGYEGWTAQDGVLDDYVMSGEDAGRILTWVISPTFDVETLPEGVIRGFGPAENGCGYGSMRRSRQRQLRASQRLMRGQ